MSAEAKWALALFLCFQGLFGLTASGRVNRIADEFEVYLQAESLVERGSQAIPQCPPDLFMGVHGIDGQPYAPYGPGVAILVLPHHMAGRGVAGAAGLDRHDPGWTLVTAAVTSLAMSTWSALAVVALFWAALGIGATPTRAALVAVALGVSTVLWTYATQFYSEPMCAALLIGAVALHLHGRSKLAAVVGCALLLVKVSNVVYVPLLLLLVSLDGWRRQRDWFFGALPMLLAVWLAGLLHVDWNVQRFGDPLQFGYISEKVVREGEPYRQFLFWDYPRGLFVLLLSPGKSLLLYAPPLLLVLPGVRRLFGERPAVAAAWVAGLVVPLLFYGCFAFPEGGYGYGPRHLVPVIPVLLLPLAVAPFLPERAFQVSLALGLAINLLGVSVSYMEDQAPGGQAPGFVPRYYEPDPKSEFGRPVFRYRVAYEPFSGYLRLLAHHLTSPPPGSGRTGLEFLPGNLLRERARVLEGPGTALGATLPWLLLLPFGLCGAAGGLLLRRLLPASLDADSTSADTARPEHEETP